MLDALFTIEFDSNGEAVITGLQRFEHFGRMTCGFGDALPVFFDFAVGANPDRRANDAYGLFAVHHSSPKPSLGPW